jgi:transcriptional regulator with XRE-family HTH domain
MEVMAAEESRVAGRLVRLRKEHALTQEAAAARAGVTLRQWQRWEAGAGEPRAGSMQKLVDAFSIDPSDFYEPSAQEEAATQLDRVERKLEALLSHFDVVTPDRRFEQELREAPQPGSPPATGTARGARAPRRGRRAR